MLDPRSRSSTPPSSPGRWSPACRRSPPTSSSTPLGPHTYWYATASVRAIPTSGSSSATPEGSSRMPHTGWPSRSSPTRAEALDVLADFSSFYFDTALSASAAALPTLLAFADPGHITFGSDWPFAPLVAAQYFAAGLDSYPGLDQQTSTAINRTNALALFPRLG